MEAAGALGAASAIARVRLTANTISAIGTTQLSRMLPGWLPDTDADDASNPAMMCEQPMSAIAPAHKRLIWRFFARNTGDCHRAGSTVYPGVLLGERDRERGHGHDCGEDERRTTATEEHERFVDLGVTDDVLQRGPTSAVPKETSREREFPACAVEHTGQRVRADRGEQRPRQQPERLGRRRDGDGDDDVRAEVLRCGRHGKRDDAPGRQHTDERPRLPTRKSGTDVHRQEHGRDHAQELGADQLVERHHRGGGDTGRDHGR